MVSRRCIFYFDQNLLSFIQIKKYHYLQIQILRNPSLHMKEKKSVIELYNTVLHKGLRKYTGLSHLPPAAADTNLIVQTFR